MNAAIGRYTRDAVEAKGWAPGSTLENRFALRLSRIGIRPPDLIQEHPVGRYRLDFADPDVLIAIEADGFYHRMPGAAERDQQRDSWLLGEGWFIFRISDDCDDHQLEEQPCGAVQLIRSEREYRGLHMHRDRGPAWKKAEPSRLAIAHGYRPKGAVA